MAIKENETMLPGHPDEWKVVHQRLLDAEATRLRTLSVMPIEEQVALVVRRNRERYTEEC